jgi:hypothetical protein
MSLFNLFSLLELKRQINSNPFHLNNNYDDEEYNNYNDNIYSLTERNNSLINYRNSCDIRMQKEKNDIKDLYTFRNKVTKFNNEINETKLELFNTLKQYDNELKIQAKKNALDLVDIIKKKQNEELEKEKYLQYLDQQINNENEKYNKKQEKKNLQKRLKQKEMIREMENENNIKLLKYKQKKEIEKEEKQKEFELKKKNFDNENEIELNKLKNKSEMADKLMYLFKNEFI